MATVIFMVGRLLNQKKSVDKICQYHVSTPQDINRCWKIIKKENLFPNLDVRTQAKDLMEESCASLGLTRQFLREAQATA